MARNPLASKISWDIYLATAVLGLLIPALLFITLHIGINLSQKHGRWIATTSKIQMEITSFHLWLEENLSGDPGEKIGRALEHFNRGRNSVLAMLNGSQSDRGTIYPIQDPQLRSQLKSFLKRIDSLRTLAENRIRKMNPGGGIGKDREFNREFKQIISDIGRIKPHLQEHIDHELRQFSWIMRGLIFLSLILALYTGFIYWRYKRGWALAYSDMDEANKLLEREVKRHLFSKTSLKESEARFRELFENMSSGVAIYEAVGDGADFIFVDFNPAAERIENISKKALLGKRVTHVFPGVESFGLLKILTQVWKTGESQHFPVTVYQDNRISGWRENYITRLSSGEVVTVYDDLTEQKQAEEERDRLFNHSLDMLSISGFDGRFRQVNPAFEKTLQWTPEEIMAIPWMDLVHPDDRESTKAVFSDIVKGKAAVRFVNRYRRKDGVYRSISWNSVPLLEEKKVLSVSRDITERLEMVEKIRASEHLLSTTLRSVGDAVITTDPNGRVTFINPTAEELTGWSLAEATGEPLEDVFHIVNEQTRQPVENPVSKVLREKNPVGLANHTALISKTGEERPIADSGAPIVDDNGDILGVVLVFRDMTQNRQNDVQLRHHQKMESIGTLAGGVAHEINNPVNIIQNFGQLIQKQAPPESQIYQDAQEIVNECKRITGIVRNLLSFSRQEQEIHSPVHLNDIVTSTLSLVKKVLAKNQIEIETDLATNLPKITCKQQQIMQVLMNLITNARDALNEKYPEYNENKRITIQSHAVTDRERPWISVSVTDFGNGIPDEIRERIFDPFFTTKPRDRGTGLGLSVSHGIVKDHDGLLEIETEKGKFTRIQMFLPLPEE